MSKPRPATKAASVVCSVAKVPLLCLFAVTAKAESNKPSKSPKASEAEASDNQRCLLKSAFTPCPIRSNKMFLTIVDL